MLANQSMKNNRISLVIIKISMMSKEPNSSASLTSMAAPIHTIAARHADPHAAEYPQRIHTRFMPS